MSKNFKDLVHQYERNRYGFSDFLGLAEQEDFYQFQKDYDSLPFTLFGGAEDCERLMLRIGSEETLGYEEPFPIVLLKLEAKNQKFADELTHRDFLGALMNLGIERDTLGDIFVDRNVGYLFCEEHIAPYIKEQLTRVKHTSITVTEEETLPKLESRVPVEKQIQVTSLRLDLIIAHTYNLSRSRAQELFTSGRVYVNGRLCENNSQLLKQGDVISVRGFGRLWFLSEGNLSKKGKHNLRVATT